MQLRTESSKAYPLKEAEPVEIRWQNGSFLVGREKRKGERLQLAPAAAVPDDTHFSLAGRTYRGSLEVLARKDGLTAVNLVPLDDYLLSVVPKEMPTDWPKASPRAVLPCTTATAMAPTALTSARRRIVRSTRASARKKQHLRRPLKRPRVRCCFTARSPSTPCSIRTAAA